MAWMFTKSQTGYLDECWGLDSSGNCCYLDDIVAAFVGDTGTIRCAYGVPFHMTHGPPPFQSVG